MPRTGMDALATTAEPLPTSIVVVEDMEDLAQTLVMLLEADGYAADYALTGEAALTLVRRLRPAAVLLDFDLPDVTGGAVARTLRQSGDFADLKVVMCTSTAEHVVKAEFDAYDAFLRKPVERSVLLETLARVLATPSDPAPAPVELDLAEFIRRDLEPIMVDFESFARTLGPVEQSMSVVALRDHAAEILLTIASDMATPQAEFERSRKSRGQAPAVGGEATAAARHGAMRQRVGFHPRHVGAEFRALRAGVLRRWQAAGMVASASSFEQMVRFNEGIDQAMAESVSAYADRMAEARERVLAALGHDLRSPLSSLSNCIHLLGSLTTPTVTRDRTRVIAARSVATIDSMVTDMLRDLDVGPVPDAATAPIEGMDAR